ncbi:MAG: hypothetical protein WA160_00125 [Pseudobdellovibrio sp.]
MKLIFLVASIITLTFTAAADMACTAYTKPMDINSLSSSAKEVFKQTQAQLASQDMGDFCKRNMLLRFLNSKNMAPLNCETWPISKLEDYVNNYVNSRVFGSTAWDLSLYSTDKLREIGFMRESGIFSNDVGYIESIEQMKKLMAAPKKSIITEAESLNELHQINKSGKDSDETTLKSLFCMKDSFFSMMECKKGLDSISEKMKVNYPKEGKTFTNMALWEKIYGSKKYDEGLRLVSNKLIERAEGSFSSDANIFDDLKSSFELSGMKKVEAQDAAFDILGLISTGGSNMNHRVRKVGGGNQKSVALAFIANSLAYLDGKKTKFNKTLYSYPTSVKTTCDNAKPYHFWMSAYLSRELKKEGLAEDTAVNSVYIAHQGYHLKREAGYPKGASNHPKRNTILTREPFDPAQQIVRTDLAYAAAGAAFGADLMLESSSKKINVDKAIISLIKDSEVVPAKTKDQADGLSLPESYYHWSNIFSPNSAIKSVKADLKN